MDVVKEESYHPLRLWNKWNETVGMHGNETVNMLVLILYTGL
jgi:hypothetical protein